MLQALKPLLHWLGSLVRPKRHNPEQDRLVARYRDGVLRGQKLVMSFTMACDALRIATGNGVGEAEVESCNQRIKELSKAWDVHCLMMDQLLTDIQRLNYTRNE